MTGKKFRMQLASRWTRVGGGFTVRPAKDPVDVEDLLMHSAIHAPADYRLFFVAATWLGTHHHFVNVRRLAKKLDALEAMPAAVAGAMIGVASEIDSSDRLIALERHCRPLDAPRVLFDRIRDTPFLRRFAQEEALALFERWGLWHNEISLKNGAVRPARWILKNCPELRIRALFGPGLDADVVEELRNGSKSVAALSRSADATYSATHAAVSRLAGRGILGRPPGERTVALSGDVSQWLSRFPAGASDQGKRAA